MTVSGEDGTGRPAASGVRIDREAQMAIGHGRPARGSVVTGRVSWMTAPS